MGYRLMTVRVMLLLVAVAPSAVVDFAGVGSGCGFSYGTQY